MAGSRADLPQPRDHRGRCLPSTCGFTRAYTEQHSGVKRISSSIQERRTVSIRRVLCGRPGIYRPTILHYFTAIKRPLPFLWAENPSMGFLSLPPTPREGERGHPILKYATDILQRLILEKMEQSGNGVLILIGYRLMC